MANATIAVGNGSLLNIVKAQVVFLLSTLTEDTYERKKAEIRDLIERHGVEIHVHLLRRLIAASHSRLTLDDPSTLYVPRAVLTFLFLVQEIQRVARSPLAADCFREAVDKGEGQIFLTFDLDRFCERIGLGPLEKLVLASPIISTFASRKSLAIQASELLQNNFDRAVALIRKSPSFDQDDLPPPEVKKLLGCLLSDSPSGHPILDVQQYHSLISSVQAKIGAEAMGELLATISHTPSVSPGYPDFESEVSSPSVSDKNVPICVNVDAPSLRYIPLLEKFDIFSEDQLNQLIRTDPQRLLNRIHHNLQDPSTQVDDYPEILKFLQDACSHLYAIPSALEVKDITLNRNLIIGKGGEAFIYHAAMGNQTVVVREVIMSPKEWKTSHGKEVIQLVHREAITHSQLHHPNILRFLGVHHETPESPPIVILPFCENGSLQDKLIGALLMETNEFDRIVAGITRGVTYLHFRNPPTIHGDLHPGNVLLDKDGNPCLCDFGLSRIRHEVTRTHTFVYQGGRARFLAPEISSGSIERISKESDIFGLAMTLFNAWTGKVPFSEITNEQQIRSIIGDGKRPERPTSTVALESEANASFWRLLVDMWVPEPYRRPSSATALWRLENPQAYPTPRPTPAPPSRNNTHDLPLEIAVNFPQMSSPSHSAVETYQHTAAPTPVITFNSKQPTSHPAPPQVAPLGAQNHSRAEPPVVVTDGLGGTAPFGTTSRTSSNSPPSPSPNSPSVFQKGGPRLKLNNLLADPLRRAIEWRPQPVLSASDRPAAWKVELIVNGRHLGTGIALRKDNAQDIAAQEALNFLGQPGVLENLRAQARRSSDSIP